MFTPVASAGNMGHQKGMSFVVIELKADWARDWDKFETNVDANLDSGYNIYTLMNYKFSSHFFSGAIIIFLSRIKTNMI